MWCCVWGRGTVLLRYIYEMNDWEGKREEWRQEVGEGERRELTSDTSLAPVAWTSGKAWPLVELVAGWAGLSKLQAESNFVISHFNPLRSILSACFSLPLCEILSMPSSVGIPHRINVVKGGIPGFASPWNWFLSVYPLLIRPRQMLPKPIHNRLQMWRYFVINKFLWQNIGFFLLRYNWHITV